MKYIIFGVLLCFLIVFMTYDYQSKIVDTRLLGIPEKCLDENEDGIYNSNDFNYSGYNNFDKSGELDLWDAKTGLGVCGDWCLGHRVEDAFVSGLELALAAV